MKELRVDVDQGYPIGVGIVYTCLTCGDTISSQPQQSTHCSCGNISIDIDYARVSVGDNSMLKIYQTD